ncbi:hypothetical protein B0H10DRAFT_1946229 [Mycena sp. CBHHK59/15]|nr:hypothetical protein B0H10DRAFT_1946229 [Mycena sp. CBHHK59/15]
MFFKKALLTAVSTATGIGTAHAFNGTATLGFYQVVNCFCPPWNGPYAVAIPSTLVGSATCCNDQITLTYLDQTVSAVFSGIYVAGEGTEDIALSPDVFGALAGHPWETALAPMLDVRFSLRMWDNVGVVFESSNKSIPWTFYARASKEIVICCGALGSPQLLLLSGIGAKEHLQVHGIKAISDLPGVGVHLQDHVGLPLMYEVPLKHTLHHTENSMLKGLLELVASTVSPMSLFTHSAHIDEKTAAIIAPIPSGGTGTNRPDLEIMTIAHWCSDPPPYKITMGVFSFLTCVVQPKSVGSVRLASGDPHARPLVDLAEDVRRQGYPMKAFQVPSSEKESDVDQFIRATIRTSYHYASFCRMASRQEGGVVDDELRVYGVRGLRVCDASVFPCIATAHTQAPVVAVAEKCADLMKI